MKKKVFLFIVLLGAVFAIPFADDHLQAVSVMLRVMDPNTQSGFAQYRNLPFREQTQVLPRGMKTRWYVPAQSRAGHAMLVVHGVHRLGVDEPRLVAFSRALASQGIEVMTPQLPGIADYRVTPESITTIGDAAKELRARTGKKVGIFGLSFSGGLALMAAADERFSEDVAFVVAVGAHHDMTRVAKFFATDEIERPDGSMQHIKAHGYGALVMMYAHPEDFFDGANTPEVRTCLQRILYETTCDSGTLSPQANNVMQHVFAQDSSYFRSDILASAEKHRAEFAQVSPRGHTSGLKAPVMLLHGAGDDVIPPAETEWLAREIPAHLLREVLVSPAISHVEVGDKPGFTDQARVVHFIAEMIDNAED
jgi:pimeloyl-ACP methyl ester carboxylesterase